MIHTPDDGILAAKSAATGPPVGATPGLAGTTPPEDARAQRKERRRWWAKLVLQPIIFLIACILFVVVLGAVQQLGWITTGDAGGMGVVTSTGGEPVRYICPMMCTPPQSEPGRCPVCAMELVPATSHGSDSNDPSIQIDPVARRVANIRTVAVRAVPLERTIRAIGQLNYDEGALRTIAAYVDGRLERLYADYTGVVVEAGDQLALLYSPQLYSSQVELLVARRSREQRRSAALPRAATGAGHDLYDSARQRLIEFGMTRSRIEQLENAGQADSRMHIVAPISGTVIEKLAVEGQYVKTGQPIYRLADLSTVWLMLELFPEDVSAIRYGQKVEAEVQSLPGRQFTGRVAFVDPMVDPKTRTVGVRVVIGNDEGLLRIGDYATATIAVQLNGSGEHSTNVHDPELADKWISPRHPHVVESSPGKCRVCGIELVPAAQFGFTSVPLESGKSLVVPRDAVLVAGQYSVVYVESEPGRFELRRVLLGPSSGDEIAVLEGLQEGELVARSGNFLIDSQMQLAGKPSLIDPTKALQHVEQEEDSPTLLAAALSGLTPDDRAIAQRQRICPVTQMALGSMGTPPKVDVGGVSVFICCEGCRGGLLKEPAKYLANLAAGTESGPASDDPSGPDLPPLGVPEIVEEEATSPAMPALPRDDQNAAAIAAAFSSLTPADRLLAERQRICPVSNMPLGSMGTPVKVSLDDRPVFICCEGCRGSLLAQPAKYTANLPKETPQ